MGSYTANIENNQTDPDAADRITFIERGGLNEKTVTAWKWLSLPLMTML